MSDAEEALERITSLVKTTDGEWLDGDDFGCLAGEIINVLKTRDGRES